MSSKETTPPESAAFQPDEEVFRSFVIDAGLVPLDAVNPGVPVDSVATDTAPPADAQPVEPAATTDS